MLEDSQKNINAFIHLIKNQPDLFLNENRNEDLKEASANFRETEDKLSDDIIAWCAKYTDIHQALRQTRKELYSTKIQSTKDDRLPGTTEPIAPPPPPPPKVSRETLLNAIQESFPNQSK
ncbi:hypothetical protein [Microcoleus sp. herbarium14]|uniref:hypothetical protein n=1 Tax=Microcoleus sp. herbarium14 TaxID=3055439 RepID=UPI002FD5E83D